MGADRPRRGAQGCRRRLSSAVSAEPAHLEMSRLGAFWPQMSRVGVGVGGRLVDNGRDCRRARRSPAGARPRRGAEVGGGRAGPAGEAGGAGRARRRRSGRPGAGRPAAGAPRPHLRLRRAGVDGRAGASGRAGQGALRRAGRRRLRGRAHRRHRARRAADPVAQDGRCRAGADAGRRGAVPPGRRALRGRELRRTTTRRAAAARHDREAGVALRRRRSGRPRRCEDAWAAYPAAPAFLRHLRTGGTPRAVWGAAPGEDWPRLLAAAGSRDPGGRPRHRDLRPGPPRRRPGRRRAPRAPRSRPARHPAGRGRARPALPRLPDGQPRRPPDRGRHPLCRVRPGPRPGTGRDLGRRGRPARRAAGALPPYPRGAARAGGDRGLRGAGRRLLPQRRGRSPAAHRLGPRDRRAPADAARTGAGRGLRGRHPERPPRGSGSGAQGGPRRRAVGPRARSGAGADAACRLRAAARLRPVPHAGSLRGLRRTPGAHRADHAAPVPLVRHGGARLGLRRVRRARAAGAGRRRRPDGRRAGTRFAPVPVVTSSGDRVRATVDAERRIVVATPGAEPVAEEGYAVVVLLDTWLLLARDSLRAAEEALRRWSNAVALLRPGGRALAVGDQAVPALQALVRWDQTGFAGAGGRRSGARRGCRRRPGSPPCGPRPAPSTTH